MKIQEADKLIIQQKYDKAISVLEPLSIGNSKLSLLARNRIALIYVNRQESEKAKAYIDEVLGIEPNNLLAKSILFSLYGNTADYDKAYEVVKTIPAKELTLDYIHAFTQATIKQGDYSKFNELGNVYDIFDKSNPKNLPEYIGISGVRNRLFEDNDLQKYLSLQQKWGNHLKEEAKQNPLTNLNKQPKPAGKITIGFYGLSNIFDGKNNRTP